MHSNYTTNKPPNNIPYGYCHCGCGQKTRIAPWNSKENSWTKGQPVRFVSGHNNQLRKRQIPPPNPSGSCQCGCGQKTAIARWSKPGAGVLLGEHVRFLPGHNFQPSLPPPNPSGLCQCGCGQKTPIAKKTCKAQNTIKGKHIRFVTGHGSCIPLAERFWVRVKIAGPDDCWEWTGSGVPKGYGTLCEGRWKRHYAHRLSYELHFGPIPDGFEVLHTCDNPPCCNPAHLYIGTAHDNMQDCLKRGRHNPPRGTRSAHAKLTDETVRAIRQAHASGVSCAELARQYGVSVSTIGAVARRGSWQHIK